MIPFQRLALPVLGILLTLELYRRLSGRDRGLANLLRFFLWLVAFVAISWPDMTTRIALVIGIKKGSNLVLYVFVFAFLGTSFYFYSRYARLERQLTQVVRHLAIKGAQQGDRERRDVAPEETPGAAAE